MKYFIMILTGLYLMLGAFGFPTPITQAATSPPGNETKKPDSIAILPFAIHTPGDVAHIQKGVANMFHSRLAWPDLVRVIPRREINAVLNGMKKEDRNRLISEIAGQTGSDFILDGSITKLAGSFSIDAKVYDLTNKRYIVFFEQSKDSDEFIAKVARIAASINKQIFDRSTATWEKIEQERQSKINDLKRKNPEYLMQNPQWQQQKESHGWEIWQYLF